MFKNIVSFNGRIRRTEYGISFIIYWVCYFFIMAATNRFTTNPIFALGVIPLLWFLWAQGAKRCHDIGRNGWWQIIPFYFLWMLFENGVRGPNQYGNNPKGIIDYDPLEYQDAVYNNPAGYVAGAIIADALIDDAIIAGDMAADNNNYQDNNDQDYNNNDQDDSYSSDDDDN